MTNETIDHPDHYQSANGIEAIDVIEAFNLNFSLGNAVKYILRAGRKGDRNEDLRKAVWYLMREVENGTVIRQYHCACAVKDTTVSVPIFDGAGAR